MLFSPTLPFVDYFPTYRNNARKHFYKRVTWKHSMKDNFSPVPFTPLVRNSRLQLPS